MKQLTGGYDFGLQVVLYHHQPVTFRNELRGQGYQLGRVILA